ncbi:MAG: MBL fold metallo-hydrolase [Ignavibacteriales bacterium]|nr:MBL fold metallo-hydrolase [Ignavibacteriales bacterium]
MKRYFSICIFFFIFFYTVAAQYSFKCDSINTSNGILKIYFIGHGTLMFEYQKQIIHVDPWNKLADYQKLPKADVILLTHHHPDHLDTTAINHILKSKTTIVGTRSTFETIQRGKILHNYDTTMTGGIKIIAVPAYNITEERNKFHPKERDNGYILSIDGKRIYIAGDTENIPEMKTLGIIDVAFLPMNQPYTMLPEQLANAARMINPKVLYPYHFSDNDTTGLRKLLNGTNIDLRFRSMR